MKSPLRGGSNNLPDPQVALRLLPEELGELSNIMLHQLKRFVLQVKGDFDALLNADSGKPSSTKQPPVLLDLRKSGSFKPQWTLQHHLPPRLHPAVM